MDLLDIITREGEVYATDIARKFKRNQKTVSNMLNRLESEDLLVSALHGKNKVFRLRPDFTRYVLLQVESMKAINLLKKHPELKELPLDSKILIFGSFAKGEEKKTSDIDMMVIGSDKKIKETAIRFNLKPDIHCMDEHEFIKAVKARQPLVMEAVKDHVILSGFDFFIDCFSYVR